MLSLYPTSGADPDAEIARSATFRLFPHVVIFYVKYKSKACSWRLTFTFDILLSVFASSTPAAT
jgi:hypothetical protein